MAINMQEAISALGRGSAGSGAVQTAKTAANNANTDTVATPQNRNILSLLNQPGHGALTSPAAPGAENTAITDAIQLALQKQRAMAQEKGGPAGLEGMLNFDWNDLINQGVSQRYAYDAGNVDAIREFQNSGEPLLDVLASWERPDNIYGGA